jgi:hypothetical protein
MAADNSFTTPADQPLPAGTYNLTLIGGYKGNATYSGAETHKATVTIKNPDPLVFSSPATSPVKCFNGTDGSISLTARGGTPDYSLLYKPIGSTSFSAVPFNAGTGLVEGLTPGDYVVSLTDINACPAKNASGAAEVTVTVTQPDAPVERDNVTATNPLAFGSADGNIIVRLKGGTPFSDGSYNVTWTKAGQPITPVNTIGSGIYTTRINNLSDGTYTLTVKDKNYDAAAAPGKEGCFYTFDVTLTEPPLLVAGIVVADSISCNGNSDGSLQVQASGGVPFAAAPYYTFRWYQEVNGVWEDLGLTGIKATGLEAGRYRVRVTDANGIERYSSPKDFIQPDELAISLIETPATCYGGSNGHVAATVAGGTSPFTYSWSNGGQQAVISNLSSGSYTLNVTDYHGCQVSTLAYVAQPAEALKIVSAPTTLPRGYGYTDGSIRVLLNGATPKADGSYNITWKSEDGTVLSSHTETKLATGYETLLSNIGAGEYILTVTDANYTGTGLPSDQQACYLEQSFTVTQPDPIVTVVSEQHYVSCKGDADGVLEVDVTGGIPFTGTGQLPYNYQWYIINNGTPVLLPHTTARAGGLKAGSYKVIVTDMNTVSNESAVYILVEPDLLEVTFDIRAVSCNSGTDGFVKTTTIGGTLPYTYSWTNGATTPDIIDVATGTYGLFLTDDHACIVQKDNVVNEPAAPLAVKDVVPTNPKAFGYTDGQIAVTLTGGTPDAAGLYNIAWFDAAGNPLTDFTQTNTANGVVTILKNRGDGDYTLKVKDAQFDNSTDGSTTGCYVAATYTLTEPLLLEAAIREYRYISCIGLSDGQLAAHAQGGIAFTTGLPYHYQWFRILNGAEVLIPQTDSIITGMPAGAYLVKVTDANNITRSSQQFTLTAPAKLEIGFTTTAVTCASGMDGEVASTVTGGTFPYHYNWTTGETTADISQLTEGTYLLFVEDAHGCVARNQVDIYIPDGIKTDPVVKAPTCHDDCNGTIQLNMSGGIAPYQYAWDNNSSEKNQSDLCAGKYTVTITDANGCKRIQAFTLENPSPLTVNIGADKTICNGQTWTVNAAIADAAASYKWSGDNNFNAVKSAVTFSQEGTYDVLVTDSKGCKGTDTIIIKQYTADIAAEFVAPTQAFSKATVSFINISYPAPEWVDWVIPAHPGISLVSKTNQMMELQFAEEGVYNITMRAHVGDCEQVFTKDITVLKGEDFATPGGAKTPFILNYTVQPNPNEGQFTVHVSLDKQADIRIRMINIISNMLVSDRKESAGQEFNLNYQLNVPAGTYLLLLETPLGNAVRKVVINK